MSRRCGCSESVCACVVTGDGTTITVTGNGTAASPYVIAATGSDTAVEALDTGSVDTTVTGTGTSVDPYVISAVVIPSGDEGNCVVLGTDGGVYAPCADGSATVVHILDTATLDMHITGTGTSGDPYIISGDVIDTESTIENVNTVATAGATQTLPDVSTATIHYLTLTANLTLTFPTAAVGKSFTVVLKQGAGPYTTTWPGTVQWCAGGTAPTLTATSGKKDVFSFMCVDGTNWIGFVAGQNA